MIDRLSISSFKCFDEVALRLRALTLLTGLNSSGKSSVMQSLALLYQTISEFETSRAILLNGPAASLGTVSDVICNASLKREYDFSIGLKAPTWEAIWTAGGIDFLMSPFAPLLSFQVRSAGDREFFRQAVRLEGSEAPGVFHLVPESLPGRYAGLGHTVRATLEGVSYLSAERIGPRETYPARLFGAGRDVGPQGELAPWCLLRYEDEPSNEGLVIQGEPATLSKQTGAWLDSFFPGAGLVVSEVPRTSLVAVEFRSVRSGKCHRPQNVGFALSQVLPIIVACLNAREGDLILIENPEVHLHPAGQSEMGYFLARAAASGVQLIVETHSDHVLNGVRRFVSERGISPEGVAIHFFGNRPAAQGDLQNTVEELSIDANGKISRWPDGFFDQITKDLLSLP